MALNGERAIHEYAVSSLHFSVLYLLFSGSLALNFSSSRHTRTRSEHDTGMVLRVNSSSEPPPQTAQQERLHPGVIAAVVVVSLLAIVAAGFIIRKYCFVRSEATYRYSALRMMEEQATEDSNTDHELDREESDEDLLE
ncbi:hypothetical protein MATL_G00109370 [Megalops atlanticus]|uniref:Uncharacterized protein n=1 Tax=Megalops atlanticus TaxID=7932 RepID=A0A9D3Q225_MEGAT|nr:hypothetical protein MATL_G00109370 [Megalops atlanticus]